VTISRRQLLTGVGLSAFCAQFPLNMAFAGSAEAGLLRSRPLNLATATPAAFRPHLGSTFRVVRDHERAVGLKLTEVKELTPAVAGSGGCFTLLFDDRRSSALAQGSYPFAHPVLGSFVMFVVPAGVGGHLAVINHVRPARPASPR
jgi:hypothetical protein